MISIDEVKKIKEITEELLQKMTITVFGIDLESSSANPLMNRGNLETAPKIQAYNGIKNGDQELQVKKSEDVVDLNIKLEEPQVLIGQNGQTLFELQRILRIILNKKLNKTFYLNLDINDYKKKKIEYLKSLARDLADEVSLTKEKKVLPPMPAYERRIIHLELAKRQDVITESQGYGADRCVVINPR